MKKLLLTLLLLLSLGFAASAAELTLTASSLGMSGTSYVTYTGSDATAGLSFAIRGSVQSGSMTFNKTSNNCFFMVTGNTNNVTINSVTITFGNSGTKQNINVYKSDNAYTQGSNDAGSVTNVTSSTKVETLSVDGAAHKVTIDAPYFGLSYSGSNMAQMSSILIDYSSASPAEKITLEESNLVIKAGEQVIEGEEVELDANTTLTFSYNTNNANADITYSYSTDATNYTEGNSYTFDGNDVTLLVKAASENEVVKKLTVTKKYPTECPQPVFSVADGAEVYAGQVITVKADGAESIMFTANDADVDGTAYTVEGNPGDEITLYALASVMGKNGEITADATITVKVVEVTEVTFDFSKNGNVGELTNPAITFPSTGSEVIDGKTFTNGVISIETEKSASGNTPNKWFNDGSCRLYKGNLLTVSAADGYYIVSVTFSGATGTDNWGDLATGEVEGSWNSTESYADDHIWTAVGNPTSVKFDASAKRCYFAKLTVKYAKLVPTLALADVEIIHGKVAGVVTVKYTFEIANHNGNEVIVTAAINGMDHIVFEKVENTPAAAPARAADENAKVKGTLQAKHADLKGEQSFSINVKATLDGNDLYNETHTNFQTTGIEDVTVEGGEAAEYFNLQGIRVAEPQAGQVYIVRRGAKTTKELVK